MEENNNKEIEFKDKIKLFFSKYKKQTFGILSAGAFFAIVAYFMRNSYGGDDSYDYLLQKREEIRMNPQSKTWASDLSSLDNKIGKMSNPRREYSKTLSDAELDEHIKSTRSIFDIAQKAFDKKTKGMSYDDYYNNPEKIELDKLYDSFYQATLEKQHRYSEANPGKFPIHREHGRYLPNDD